MKKKLFLSLCVCLIITSCDISTGGEPVSPNLPLPKTFEFFADTMPPIVIPYIKRLNGGTRAPGRSYFYLHVFPDSLSYKDYLLSGWDIEAEDIPRTGEVINVLNPRRFYVQFGMRNNNYPVEVTSDTLTNITTVYRDY